MSATRRRSRPGSATPIRALRHGPSAVGPRSIFWDESGFRADVVQGTTWGVKGRTPIVAVPGTRQSVSAASAVNAKGAFWFATYKGAMSAELFIAMLGQIMRRRQKPLFLILDSLPAHKAKVVHSYVKSTGGKLELYFLPGYAPELNPDELVWNYMKRTGTAKRRSSKVNVFRIASRPTCSSSRTIQLSSAPSSKLQM